MRRVFLIISLIMFTLAGEVFSRDIGNPYKFVYTIVDVDGAHVSGQTPTVKIQKSSNGYWYDFSDGTFKNSGWTSKTVTLTEDATNGIYYYTFTPPASETSAEVYIFVVDNVDATYADHGSLAVEYQSYVNEIKRSRGR